MTQYWLMKSEPDDVSIDDALAAPRSTVAWTGVRNFQARNFMREQMRIGDGVLFYHSSCPQPGIAGIASVASTPYPDPSQFDKASAYYDATSKKESPKWYLVDVKAERKTRLMSLQEMRETPALEGMTVLRKGNRLSITPVSEAHWKVILKLIG